MEDNLAAEIARIEAELEAERQYREQQQQQQQLQQQQQQQQQPHLGSQGVMPTLGVSQGQQQPQQFSHPQTGTNHMAAVQHPHHHHHPQSLQHGVSGVSVPTSGQPHQFSKESDARSVFVGNLPKGENGGPTSTPEELAQFFADCGPILNCTLLRDRATGELKGTAYVEFATYTGMGKAIDTKNNSNFKGSTIIVTKKRSAFRPERARGGRGGGGGGGRGGAVAAADPYQAMMALMGMMAGSAMVQRGGRGGGGRGGRGRGSSSGHAPAANSFQPFQ